MPAYVEEMIYDDDGSGDDAPLPSPGQRGGAPPLPTRDRTATLTALPAPSAPRAQKAGTTPVITGDDTCVRCGPWQYGRNSTVAPPPKSWAVFRDVQFAVPKLVTHFDDQTDERTGTE